MSEVNITEWTLDGVLEEIINVHNNMKDRHYAFILGAGASKSSGINTGHELAQRWLEEIYRRECLDKTSSIEEWLASGNSGFTDSTISFADAGSHYPQIFERRFYGDREAGYAALEDAIEGKIPSLGYSLLASIIQETRHKVVITTNFDNLVADALSMQAHQSPLIVAHESLAGFVRPNLRRPLVAKIHRDLFLSPKNDRTGVSMMEESWKEALKKIFQHYTPVVIGYGGNDGSLMDMLNDLPEGSISGRIFWCCRDPAIPQKAKDVLIKHKGVLTKITGFDEFMLQLAKKLVPDFIVEKIPETLEHLGKTRAQDYREQIKKITKSSTDDTIRKIVLDSATKQDDWWSWQLKIDAETDPDKRQALYVEATRKIPDNPHLTGNYALFVDDIRKDYNKAEELYQKAIELDPNDSNNNSLYAIFLHTIRKEYDKAETLYQKAIELDPSEPNNLANYFCLLTTQKAAQASQQANQFIKRIIKITRPKPMQVLAEALLYSCLGYELFPEIVKIPALPRLKNLIKVGFERGEWSFEYLFDVVLPDLSDEKQKFYRALGDAILDEQKVSDLEKFRAWTDCEEVDFFADFDSE